MELIIRNMVCPRCIAAVSRVLQEMQLSPADVQLGRAVITVTPGEGQLQQLKGKLQQQGFELLEDSRAQLADRIKSVIIEQIQHPDAGHIVFSELLADRLHRDYSGLSKLFSAVEGITIEQFIILQKTEKVKELLLYNEMTLSEIADRLGYSSVAHLSAQFRKTTGITPTAFRAQGHILRKPLDGVAGNL